MKIPSIFNIRRDKTRPQFLFSTKDHPLAFRHEARPLNQPLLLIERRLEVIRIDIWRVLWVLLHGELVDLIVKAVLFAQHEVP